MNHVSTRKSAFIFGLIVGGATAMLLTPKRGDEMRKEIRNKVEQIKSNADDATDEKANELHTSAPMPAM